MPTGLAQPPQAHNPPSSETSLAAPQQTTEPPPPALGPEGHGWAAVQRDTGSATLIYHFPPRGRPGADRRGTIQVAPGFAGAAEMLAWCDSRLYVALKVEQTPAGWQRRVFGVSAVPTGAGGWEYPPGRPVVLAALPAQPELVSFSASRFGPVALLRDRFREGEPVQTRDLRLLVLNDTAWTPMPLPWQASPVGSAPTPAPPRPDDAAYLITHPDRVDLFVQHAGADTATLWTAPLPASLPKVGTGATGLPAAWTAEALPMTLARPDGATATFTPEHVVRVDRHLIGTTWAGGALRVVAMRPSAPYELAVVADVPRDHKLVPMDGSGTLAVFWHSADPGSRSAFGGLRAIELREISVSTGRFLHTGPLRVGLPAGQLRALSVLLLLVMVAVVIFVLRAEPGTPLQLPRGVLLAEPGRRVLAGLLDYLPAALLAESFFNLPTGTLMTPIGLATRDGALWALLVALGIACAYCVLGEWAAGRSPGKVLTGCQVLAVGPAPAAPGKAEPGRARVASLRRPRFWQCAARNLVRWGVPALGLFMLLDPARRHPGDILAGTLVLVPEPPPDEPDET